MWEIWWENTLSRTSNWNLETKNVNFSPINTFEMGKEHRGKTTHKVMSSSYLMKTQCWKRQLVGRWNLLTDERRDQPQNNIIFSFLKIVLEQVMGNSFTLKQHRAVAKLDSAISEFWHWNCFFEKGHYFWSRHNKLLNFVSEKVCPTLVAILGSNDEPLCILVVAFKSKELFFSLMLF